MTTLTANNKKLNYFHLIWRIMLLGIAVYPYILSIIYAPVQPDAGYYLAVIERIREGLIPERDFQVGYTPLFFFIIAFLKDLFNIGVDYAFDLAIHFLFQILTTFFIYKTSIQLLNSKPRSYFVAVLYLLISYWICDYEFLLEIPSIMWGFMGIVLLLRNPKRYLSFFFIGIVLSLSYLTKQYGLGFLVLTIFLMIFQLKNKIGLNYISLFAGYTLPIFILIIFIPETTKILLGNGYGIGSENNTDNILIHFWNNAYICISYFVYRLPIILIAFLFFPLISNEKRTLSIFLILGMIGFSFQFIFAPLKHYLLYIVPFVTIYIFVVYESINKRKLLKYLYLILIILSFGFSIKRDYSRSLNFDKKLRLEQIEIKNKLLKHIEPSENIYISDYRLIYLYYLLNIHPVDMNYSFGIAINEQDHYCRIKKADNVITWNNYKTLYFNDFFSERVSNYFYYTKTKIFIYKKENHLNELTNKLVPDQVVLYKNN